VVSNESLEKLAGQLQGPLVIDEATTDWIATLADDDLFDLLPIADRPKKYKVDDPFVQGRPR
jgi:hypothetical protein